MKFKKWLRAVVSGLLVSLISIEPASAEVLKIAYVDADKILLEAPQGKQALRKLEEEFDPRDKGLKEMASKLKKMEDEFNSGLLVLSSADQRRLEMTIIQLRRRLKQSQQELREDYNWRRNEELTKLQKLVRQAIEGVAKEEGYNLIIDDKIYVSPRLDITKKVLEKLAGELRSSGNAADK